MLQFNQFNFFVLLILGFQGMMFLLFMEIKYKILPNFHIILLNKKILKLIIMFTLEIKANITIFI